MEETISLKEIFGVIKKRFMLIVAFVLGAALIAAVFSYFIITPQYESRSQFIVNQSQQDPNMAYNINDIRTNVELINTYNAIMERPRILDEVIEELGLDYSAGTLSSKIKVSSEQNSQVVNVTVTDPNPALATQIANTTVKVFQDTIPDITNVDNVKILSAAEMAENPLAVSPKPLLNIAIALVLGGMIGVGLAFLLEYLDNTIRTEDDVEKELGLPVLGVISTMTTEDLRQGRMPMHQQSRVKRGGFSGAQKKTV